MATYVEVSQALINAGYLTYADIDAANAILATSLSVDYYDDFYADAATALWNAELIDEANLDIVASTIDGVWIID